MQLFVCASLHKVRVKCYCNWSFLRNNLAVKMAAVQGKHTFVAVLTTLYKLLLKMLELFWTFLSVVKAFMCQEYG